MTTYYVDPSGNNASGGTAASPFRTIQYALNQPLNAGDTIVVRAGTYAESLDIRDGGSAAGNVTLMAETPGSVRLTPPSGSWNAISVNANYVTIKGFEIANANGDGIEANSVHHIEIIDNTVHGSGESGIQFNYSDFILIEGNTTYGNASDGWFSGISIYQNRNITGDTSTDGFRTIVRDNISYDNVTKTGAHTDGNGIIIDDFQSTQTSGYPSYTYATLVENNLVYLNGGKGIQVTWSDNVTVRDNTAYHNNQDPLNTGTWRGEISNSQSSDNTFVNNIAVADPRVNSNNTAIDNTSYGGYSNDNVVWANNLTFNGTAGAVSVKTDGGNPVPSAANGNLLGVDPRFVNPGAGDFHLRADSPAVDAGTSAYGLPKLDLDGDARVEGKVDMGAYEQGSASPQPPAPPPPPAPAPNTAPVAVDDAGFVVAQGAALKIAEAALLANDSDPDGDPISIVQVGGASNGTVALGAGDTIVFTPAAGFSGTAGFDYRVTDDAGAGDTGHVTVEVTPAPVTPPPPPVEGPTTPPVEPGDGSSFSLWDANDTPDITADSDTAPVTLGLRFTADEPAELDALRIWVSDENIGRQRISLWSDDGTRLDRATGYVTEGGWQTVEFDAPVTLEAGKEYVASYYTPRGHYAVSQDYFETAQDAGPISLDANAGVFSYGRGTSFPDESYEASNYWIDVVVRPSGGTADEARGLMAEPADGTLDGFDPVAADASHDHADADGWAGSLFSSVWHHVSPYFDTHDASAMTAEPDHVHVEDGGLDVSSLLLEVASDAMPPVETQPDPVDAFDWLA